jgi:excisionase family DNA binding protein
MLWKTHNRISNEVLRRLGITLSSEVYTKFKEGIVAPDQWKDYPHHHGKSEAIKSNIMYARQCYLQNDLPGTFYYLGVALHYIQDSYTSVVSYDSPNNQVWHQNYEQSIEDSEFVYNLENRIQYFFRNDDYQLNKYGALAKNLSGKVVGKAATLRAATLVGEYASDQTGKPKVDLNMALLASLVVTESVLNSKTCPALETQLKDVLLQHEEFLRNAEIESANNVIRLIKERDELIKKKVPPNGIVSKIKNWIIGIRVSLKNRAASSKTSEYFHRTHLEDVANNYKAATKRVIVPFEGWYTFQIPKLNPNIISKELLSVQEIAEVLGERESYLKESLHKFEVSSYSVGNDELVRRAELDRFLSQSPVYGFSKYLL